VAVVIQIECPDASTAALREETVRLARLLSGRGGLVVERPPDAPIGPGERGGVVELGKLLLSFATPAGVETLIEGLTAYLSRGREFTVALTSETGAKIEISGRNMSPDTIVETAGRLRALLAAAT
jgi:hypothetical protein